MHAMLRCDIEQVAEHAALKSVFVKVKIHIVMLRAAAELGVFYAKHGQHPGLALHIKAVELTAEPISALWRSRIHPAKPHAAARP